MGLCNYQNVASKSTDRRGLEIGTVSVGIEGKEWIPTSIGSRPDISVTARGAESGGAVVELVLRLNASRLRLIDVLFSK